MLLVLFCWSAGLLLERERECEQENTLYSGQISKASSNQIFNHIESKSPWFFFCFSFFPNIFIWLLCNMNVKYDGQTLRRPLARIFFIFRRRRRASKGVCGPAENGWRRKCRNWYVLFMGSWAEELFTKRFVCLRAKWCAVCIRHTTRNESRKK